MSLLSKVQKLKSDALKEIANKANEVRNLNKDLENFIAQVKKEISSETDSIEKKKRELIREEQRIDILRKKTTTELEKLQYSIERRIDWHIDDVIEWFEELETHGKDPRIIDAY